MPEVAQKDVNPINQHAPLAKPRTGRLLEARSWLLSQSIVGLLEMLRCGCEDRDAGDRAPNWLWKEPQRDTYGKAGERKIGKAGNVEDFRLASTRKSLKCVCGKRHRSRFIERKGGLLDPSVCPTSLSRTRKTELQ